MSEDMSNNIFLYNEHTREVVRVPVFKSIADAQAAAVRMYEQHGFHQIGLDEFVRRWAEQVERNAQMRAMRW